MCEPLSAKMIRVKPAFRDGEAVMIRFEVDAYCPDCEKDTVERMFVRLTCDTVRRLGNDECRKQSVQYLSAMMRTFGPISYQRICEAVTDQAQRTDFVKVAGTPYLTNMQPAGHA
jgi:hypothetical protein